MLKKTLNYMLDNDPDKTISQKGSNVRKKIRPAFVKLLALSNKLKLQIERKSTVDTDRPIIYVASHAFKDDVQNTILTIKDDTYIVFGNIDLFYNTFDGLGLWIHGTQLVNRYDKESRHAMLKKMDKIIEYGNNILIFPEATWNMSPNHLMEKLHWGFYDTAIKNNALVVPVITYKVGKNCYARQLDAIDLKNVEDEDVESIIRMINKFISKGNDLNIYKGNEFTNYSNLMKDLKTIIDAAAIDNNKDKKIDYIKAVQDKAKEYLDNKEEYNYEDEFKQSSVKLMNHLVSRISTATKEVMVKKVRDIMATEKYDLFEKHPDYSHMKDGKDIYSAWDDYIDETIKGTPYFYPEPEKTTLLQDPLEVDIEDVMPKVKQKRR